MKSTEIARPREVADLYGGREQMARRIIDAIHRSLQEKSGMNLDVVLANQQVTKNVDLVAFFARMSKDDFIDFLTLNGIEFSTILPDPWENRPDDYAYWKQEFIRREARVLTYCGKPVPEDIAAEQERRFMSVFIRIEALNELCLQQKPDDPRMDEYRKRFKERLKECGFD